MSPRTRATFAKRQKEQARQEKQRTKLERKQQRKLENQAVAGPAEAEEIAPEKEAAPEILAAPTFNYGPESGHNRNSKESS